MCAINAITHRGSQRLFDHELYLIKEAMIFSKAAGMDIRSGNDLSALRIDNDDNGDESFFTQNSTILQRTFGNFTDALTININETNWNGASNIGVAIGHIDDDSIFNHQSVSTWHTSLNCKFGVSSKMSPFTVNWHDILWLNNVVAIKEFTSSGVTRYVDHGIAFVNDIGTKARELIDNSKYGIFISWDQG